MKPPAFKSVAVAALAAWLAVSPAAWTVRAGEATPKPEAAAKDKKGKGRKDTADSTLPPPTKKHGPKEIPFPVPVGRPFTDSKIPSYDSTGKLLSQIIAARGNRIDNEHVQLESTVFDLNDQNGNPEYKIELPVCIFNLQTNVVTSEQPVVIRTKDFELSGEKMDFNTVERSGELRGRVHMIIRNMKQLANVKDESPAPK